MQFLSLVEITAFRLENKSCKGLFLQINFPPKRALKFITGHVIFKLHYNQIYQLTTTHNTCLNACKINASVVNEIYLYFLTFFWFICQKRFPYLWWKADLIHVGFLVVIKDSRTTSNMDRQLLRQKLVKKSHLNENLNVGVSVVFKSNMN